MYCCSPTSSSKPDEKRHTTAIVASSLDEYVWATFEEACSNGQVMLDAWKKLESRRAEEVLSQLEIRRTLLDDNHEQQNGLVDALTHLKQDSAKARIAQHLDTLAAEEARIQASIAQLEQKDAVLVASQTVLPDTSPAKAGRF